MVLSYLPTTVILKGNGNLWWAGSLHKGFEWLQKNARTGDVLLINDDTTITRDFLQQGVDLLAQNPKTIFLAEAYDKNNNYVTSGVHVDWSKLMFSHAKNEDEINCLSTRGLFLKVEDFFKIGGFHPFLLPHYLSDYELTIRARNKGYKLATEECLKLILNTETTGFHEIKYESYYKYLKIYFSKKNPSNPIYFISFLILACPKKYLPKNILKILYGCLNRCLQIGGKH